MAPSRLSSGFQTACTRIPILTAFGMKVQAVWKSEDEREGAITDILYFKPV